MQTSVGIFRGQEDMHQFDIFPKVNNSPPILALEICRERMVILILITGKYELLFFLKYDIIEQCYIIHPMNLSTHIFMEKNQLNFLNISLSLIESKLRY